MQQYQNNMRCQRNTCQTAPRQMQRANCRPVPIPCMEHTAQSSNSCRIPRDPMDGMVIAMAYVPWQKWQNISEVCRGMEQGTIFEELNKPFCGKGGCNR